MKRIVMSIAPAMGITGICLSVALLSMIVVPGAAMIAIKPRAQEFAYCAAPIDAKVFQYRIGPDGTLQPLKPPTVPAKAGPFAIVLSPDRRFVYVPCSDVILQYRIGPDGTLKLLPEPQAPLPGGYEDLLFMPDGHFAYATDHDAGGVRQYAVSSAGPLRPLKPASVPTGRGDCMGITMAPDGHTLYASNLDGTLSQFRIGRDGRLAPLTPAYLLAAQGHQSKEALALIFDPSGRYAYLTSETPIGGMPGALSLFDVRVGGGLKYLSVIGAPAGPTAQRHGSTLFVEGSDGPIDQYRIGKNGNLTQIGASLAPRESTSLLSFTPDGRFAYLTSDEGTVWQFRFQPDGSLAALPGPPIQTSLAELESIEVDPSGRFAYAVSGWRGIAQFRIRLDGILIPLTPPTIQAGGAYRVTIVQLPTPASHKKAARGKRH